LKKAYVTKLSIHVGRARLKLCANLELSGFTGFGDMLDGMPNILIDLLQEHTLCMEEVDFWMKCIFLKEVGFLEEVFLVFGLEEADYPLPPPRSLQPAPISHTPNPEAISSATVSPWTALG